MKIPSPRQKWRLCPDQVLSSFPWQSQDQPRARMASAREGLSGRSELVHCFDLTQGLTVCQAPTAGTPR